MITVNVLSGGETRGIELELDTPLFLLGGNGSGKSSLLHNIFKQNPNDYVRISAHRQMWFGQEELSMSKGQLVALETSIRQQDIKDTARWKDQFGSQKFEAAILNLLDECHNYRRDFHKLAIENSTHKPKLDREFILDRVNKLLKESGFELTIELAGTYGLTAKKNGCPAYSIAKTSDGERSAIYIAAIVLTAKPGSLLLLDEPERHLHRSISSPFISGLLNLRDDCYYCISTHDIELAVDNVPSQSLLVRGFTVEGNTKSWAFDLVSTGDGIDDSLLVELLGARKKILFVEGEEMSLDKPLYNILFSGTTVVPRGSSVAVETTCKSLLATGGLHWLQVFGVVDLDGKSDAVIEKLKAIGVFALNVNDIEGVYFLPMLQELAFNNLDSITDGLIRKTRDEISELVFTALRESRDYLVSYVSRRKILNQYWRLLPKRDEIVFDAVTKISVDNSLIYNSESEKFDALHEGRDFEGIILNYPIKKTRIPQIIARALGFKDKDQYFGAVRGVLISDEQARQDTIDALEAGELVGSLEVG